MQRRLLPVFACLLLVAAACTADDGDGGGATGGAAASDGGGGGTEIDEESVSGEVRFSGWRSSDSEEALLEETIAAFEEAYPNITVEYQPIPEGYIDQMTAQFSAGEPPDLFYVQAEFSDAWMEDGLLEPLDPYLQGNPEFDVEPFNDELLGVFQFEGQTFGLPKDAGPLGLFYNTDMLEAAGVEPPTTWDELEAAAEALTTGDVAGLCVGAELPRVGAFIYQAGGGIYNDDKTELTITSSESVEGIDFYLQLHEAGVLRTPAELGADWCGAAFGQGLAAMTMEGTWLFPPMENDFPDINFETAELPMGAEQGNLSFTNAYGIGVDSANKEAAWVLLQYLAGPEGMEQWTSLGLALPTRDDVPAPEGRDAFVAGLEYGTAYAFGRDFGDIQTAFNNALTRVLDSGGIGQEIADETAAAAE
jgi:multiple sugar transport system substrate-binding protein